MLVNTMKIRRIFIFPTDSFSYLKAVLMDGMIAQLTTKHPFLIFSYDFQIFTIVCAYILRAGSCAIDFQTESVLVLNKKTESELEISIFKHEFTRCF